MGPGRPRWLRREHAISKKNNILNMLVNLKSLKILISGTLRSEAGTPSQMDYSLIPSQMESLIDSFTDGFTH